MMLTKLFSLKIFWISLMAMEEVQQNRNSDIWILQKQLF